MYNKGESLTNKYYQIKNERNVVVRHEKCSVQLQSEYLYLERLCCSGFSFRPSACRDIYGGLRKVVSP